MAASRSGRGPDSRAGGAGQAGPDQAEDDLAGQAREAGRGVVCGTAPVAPADLAHDPGAAGRRPGPGPRGLPDAPRSPRTSRSLARPPTGGPPWPWPGTRPDVVLMDLSMPEVDGLTATRRITADPQLAAVRVVVLTTFDDESTCSGRSRDQRVPVKDVEPENGCRGSGVAARGDALLATSVTRSLIAAFTTGNADAAARVCRAAQVCRAARAALARPRPPHDRRRGGASQLRRGPDGLRWPPG